MEEFSLYATLFALLAFYIWFRAKNQYSRNTKKSPPSPPKLPIIGNLHQVGSLPHRSLSSLSRKHGPLMLLHLGYKPTIVVSSAEVAKEVLKTHDISFADKPDLSILRRIFYDSKDVFNLPYGGQWRNLRNIFVNQLLSNKRVKSFNIIREEEARFLMEEIKKASLSSMPVNLTEMFVLFTNNTISRSVFGKRYSETEHGKKFIDTTDEAVGLFKWTVGELIPWLAWINRLNGFDRKVDRISKSIDEIMDSIVQEHLDRVTETSSKEENFVDILLGIYNGNTPGVSIDRTSVKAVIFDVFGAGTETSSTALGWTMTELIRHPNVMKKLQKEIREIMKGKQDITDDDLEKMHYLKAVIKENFRYHPPLPTFLHRSREDVNLMGYDIPSGTMILFNAWAISREPASWDEPEKFMPERFLDSSIDFKGFDFQLIPFGAGRRICPGIGFANASMEHVLANLMHKFDWELVNGTKGEDLDVTESSGITIRRKNPLIVVPTKCYF